MLSNTSLVISGFWRTAEAQSVIPSSQASTNHPDRTWSLPQSLS